MEIRRDHADDGIVLAVEREALAQNVVSRAEFPLPQSCADQRHWFRAELVFTCCETAADDRIHAQRGKKSDETSSPLTCSGSPALVRLKP